MSLRAVHAGAGYQYLLRSVATNDAYDHRVDSEESRTALAEYYHAKGTPPGRWLGNGLIGFNSETIATGELIDAGQMANLYGVGLHPEAEKIWTNGGSFNDAKLGRSFRVSTRAGNKNIPVLVALKAAEEKFITDYQRAPTAEERSEMAYTVGREYYSKETGYEHPSGADVIGWVNEQKAKTRQAVAGFDWTFSPVKSVSVLWALADEETANKIAACHHKAVAEAITWAEGHVARTRIGTNGIEQVETKGLIASEFTHFDTRTGDPDLHSHVLVSNKVQAPDGRWLTLDSQEVFRNAQAVSARYDVALMDILSREIGLSFTPTQRENETVPVWEVAGVPEELIKLFSSRRELARPLFEQMVDDYVQRRGKQPDQAMKKRLWQNAILETRDEKKPAESLADLRSAWEKRVQDSKQGEKLLAQVKGLTQLNVVDNRREFGNQKEWDNHVEEVAETVLAQVTEKRGVFGDHHIKTAVATELKGWKFESQETLNQVQEEILDHILTRKAVCLSPAEVLNLPSQLLADNALGVDRRVGRFRYTTQEVLDAEQVVLAACEEPTVYTAPNKAIDQALIAHEKAQGWALNEGQEAMARDLLTNGALVSCGVGPAGTGKTTSMQIVSKVWAEQGRSVIGLAPSAQAAKVLGEEIGCEATTIDKLTFTWRGANPNKPGHDINALPITINPGDMLLVDEAGMASTQNLSALVEIAQATGAVVRMIGDPYQLSAVGSGGLFGAACNLTDAVELTHVMRFSKGTDIEQADASLQIRRGDKDGIDLYEQRGWVAGGARTEMLNQAVADYLDDLAHDRTSLIIAATNADVDAMNQAIREHRITTGEVDKSKEIEVGRGDSIGVGDVVITRKNQIFYTTVNGQRVVRGKVNNGQLFSVVSLHKNGDIEVRDQKTGARQVIPADYAKQQMHLGYAATVHRAQGATVDVCRAVIDSAVDRAGLYVALTRGKKENRAYCVTDEKFDFDAEDAHYHMSGEQEELTSRTVLLRALANDNRTRAATETAHIELADTFSRDRVAALYARGHELATADLVDQVRTQLIDSLPRDVATHMAAESEPEDTLTLALKRCCEAGVDIRPFSSWNALTPWFSPTEDVCTTLANCIDAHNPQARSIKATREAIISALPAEAQAQLSRDSDSITYVDAALQRCRASGTDIAAITDDVAYWREWETAENLGNVLAWRINQFQSDSSPIPAPPPPWVGQDTELAAWLHETYQILQTPTRQPAPEIPPGSVIEGKNFQTLSFSSHTIEDVEFVDCDFRGVDLTTTKLRHVTFKNCQMDATDFTEADLSRVNFEASELPDARFNSAVLSAESTTAIVRFTDCLLEKAQFVKATITNAVFDTCNLIKADFRKIAGEFGFFYHSTLTGSLWSDAPQGGFSDLTATHCVGENENPIVKQSVAHQKREEEKTAQEQSQAVEEDHWWKTTSQQQTGDKNYFL